MLRKYLILLLSAISMTAVVTFSGNAAITAAPNWKQHTAFDCQPVKILDSERFTYFLIRQNYFNPQQLNGTYKRPQGALLYYDKQAPSEGIHQLHDRVQLGSFEIRDAAYNHTGKYLMIVYTDGIIDLVEDNGEVHTIASLKTATVPFSKNTFHITFPLGSADAWVGSETGYIHIDGKSHDIAEMVRLNKRVRAVSPVGDRIMAIIENTSGGNRALYEADANKTITGMSDFRTVSVGTSTMDFIMPLSGNAFATIDGSNINVVNRAADGSYTLKTQLTDSSLPGQLYNDRYQRNKNGAADGQIINYRSYLWSDNEHNGIEMPGGYLVISKDYVYNIHKSVNGEGNATIDKKKLKDWNLTWIGSTDFQTFWTYEFRKGFAQNIVSGNDDNATWEMSEPMAPEVPVAFENARLMYSPKFGVLMRNGDLTRLQSTPNMSTAFPLLMSSYKDGKWTNRSIPYIMPEFAIKNGIVESMTRTLKSLKSYPSALPVSWCMDEVYDDYVLVNTPWQGFSMINLANPTGEIMMFNRVPDSNGNGPLFSNYPGYYPLLPYTTPRNSEYTLTKSLGTDNDGTMWVYYCNQYVSSGNSNIDLYYWTKDARKAAMEAQDITKSETWKKLTVPMGAKYDTQFNFGTVLKHNKNRNKILICGEGNTKGLIMFDHNGTPDDSTDDQVWVIKKVRGINGDVETSPHQNTALVEDPMTGNVFLSTIRGAFMIDPSQPVVDNTAVGEYMSLGSGNEASELATTTTVGNMAFDEYNRLWIATNGNGVIRLSADKKSIEAHYTTENSPLPSNYVWDLCWSPDTKEMVIATMYGVASVKPDNTPVLNNTGMFDLPYISPEIVTPDMASTVTIFNVPGNSSITVYDREGHAIAHPVVENGTCTWNLHDKEGKHVSAGAYTLRDEKGNISDQRVVIVR